MLKTIDSKEIASQIQKIKRRRLYENI